MKEEDKSCLNDPLSSVKSRLSEKSNPSTKLYLSWLREKVRGLRDDLQILTEKLADHMNIIANYIVKIKHQELTFRVQ